MPDQHTGTTLTSNTRGIFPASDPNAVGKHVTSRPLAQGHPPLREQRGAEEEPGLPTSISQHVAGAEHKSSSHTKESELCRPISKLAHLAPQTICHDAKLWELLSVGPGGLAARAGRVSFGGLPRALTALPKARTLVFPAVVATQRCVAMSMQFCQYPIAWRPRSASNPATQLSGFNLGCTGQLSGHLRHCSVAERHRRSLLEGPCERAKCFEMGFGNHICWT